VKFAPALISSPIPETEDGNLNDHNDENQSTDCNLNDRDGSGGDSERGNGDASSRGTSSVRSKGIAAVFMSASSREKDQTASGVGVGSHSYAHTHTHAQGQDQDQGKGADTKDVENTNSISSVIGGPGDRNGNSVAAVTSAEANTHDPQIPGSGVSSIEQQMLDSCVKVAHGVDQVYSR
jgi:hypothetical protein